MSAERPLIFAREPRLLNIGCGGSWHPDWLNCDVRPASPEVRTLDARCRIPIADGGCDAVYHSHVLEHLEPRDARRFMAECSRVLKTGGVLRVAVPDLERIACAYLDSLQAAIAGGDRFAYDWAVLELYDQTVRQQSGGQMGRIMRDASDEQARHISWRVGEPGAIGPAQPGGAARLSRAVRARGGRAAAWASRAWWRAHGKEAARSLESGRFRNSGEIHLWMYDRFSLGELMGDVGLTGVTVCPADQSRTPGFNDFNLDCEEGRVRKPDSLFMEGSRPE